MTDNWENEGGMYEDTPESLKQLQDMGIEPETKRPVENRVDNEYDPFNGGKDTNIAILITLMRIYDVQLALLSEKDDEIAEKLMKLHEQGKVVSSLPGIDL